MHTLQPADGSDFPSSVPAVAAERAIERAFPYGVVPGDVVITGHGLRTPAGRHALASIGRAATHAARGEGRVAVMVARGGRTALVAVPMPIAVPARRTPSTRCAHRSRSSPLGCSLERTRW